MKMESFGAAQLNTAIRVLPPWKRVAFMAYCCERMLPNYGSFKAETSYGDLVLLRSALDVAWKWIELGEAPNSIVGLSAACEAEAPDTSEFKSSYTSSALDAATAIATTLEALKYATEDRAIEVASLARDSVDLYVQEALDLDPNDPCLEEKIAGSNLMQTELRIQRESLEMLKELPDNRSAIGSDLRLHWSYLREGSLPPTSATKDGGS